MLGGQTVEVDHHIQHTIVMLQSGGQTFGHSLVCFYPFIIPDEDPIPDTRTRDVDEPGIGTGAIVFGSVELWKRL